MYGWVPISHSTPSERTPPILFAVHGLYGSLAIGHQACEYSNYIVVNIGLIDSPEMWELQCVQTLISQRRRLELSKENWQGAPNWLWP